MANCYRCSAETELFNNGLPICLKCDEELVSKTRMAAPEPQSDRRAAPADNG